jgi:transposase
VIDPEVIVKIRQLYFAEHWKIGTIASQLGLHYDTVRGAIGADAFNRARRERLSQLTAPYLEFIQNTLKDYPRLRATRIFQMIRARGYEGSVSQLRRIVAGLRPSTKHSFNYACFRASKARPIGRTLDRFRSAEPEDGCPAL